MPCFSKQQKRLQKRVHKVQVWSAADHPVEWGSVSGFHLIDYSNETRERMKDLIARTQHSDTSFKIFSVHWGPNYAWQPAREIRSLGESEDLFREPIDTNGYSALSHR